MTGTKRPLFKNILGDTRRNIAAIQRFIEKNSAKDLETINQEENPSRPINRVINSVLNEDIANEIEKIIKNL